MTFCKACEKLKGQSGEIDPHDHLRGEAHIMQRDGVLEAYRCRDCGAQWQRFVGAKTLGTQSGSWKTLGSS